MQPESKPEAQGSPAKEPFLEKPDRLRQEMMGNPKKNKPETGTVTIKQQVDWTSGWLEQI